MVVLYYTTYSGFMPKGGVILSLLKRAGKRGTWRVFPLPNPPDFALTYPCGLAAVSPKSPLATLAVTDGTGVE